MDTAMKQYYVELIRMKLGMLKPEPVDKEQRIFTTIEKAEKWLTDNGFIYGQRRFFHYPAGDCEWFHKDDLSLEYIDVIITEMESDDLSNSKFKDLKQLHMEWLPQFLKDLHEEDDE